MAVAGGARAKNRAPSAPRGAGWLGLVLAHAGCSSELSYGRLRDTGAVTPVEGGLPALPDAQAPFSCAQRGPWFDLGDGAPAACGAASRGFHYALAACETLNSTAHTKVYGFDSRIAPYAAGQNSGALAARRGLYLTTGDIGGSVWITGSTGAPLTGDLIIGGNLFDEGPLLGPSHVVRVGGDAKVRGDVRLAALQVAGRFTLGEASALEVAAGAPPVTRGQITIPEPCRCDEPLDLSPLIEAASHDNDNAAVALLASSSLKLFDSERELSLPCGRYYVEDIYAAGALTVRVLGRVALYVRSGIVVESTGALTIRLEDDAELDLFVQQGISGLGPVQIGAPAAPTRTRLHFGVDGALSFSAPALFAASLYAPRAELVAQGGFELFGAALVRRVASGPLTLHYDRALAGDRCRAARCSATDDCAPGLRCDTAQCLP